MMQDLSLGCCRDTALARVAVDTAATAICPAVEKLGMRYFRWDDAKNASLRFGVSCQPSDDVFVAVGSRDRGLRKVPPLLIHLTMFDQPG